jgi:hypothetical protein
MDNNYWWKKNKGTANQAVFEFLNRLEADQSYRSNENFKFMRLYGNNDLLNLKAYQYYRVEPSTSVQNRVTMNIVQSMIDTVVSKITKNKPKPNFLTDGGDFSQQRRAKKLTKFVEGQFQMTDFYSKATQAFMDSCIFGTGALKIFKNEGEICVERVFIDEIIIDDKEAFYGEPRQMHQRKYIHKDILKQMFPSKAGAIEVCNQSQISNYYNSNVSKDMLLVVESWHLPSGKNAKDGKHCITIDNETLLEEEYSKAYFPFVFFRWGLRPLGFFGQGLAEQLQGLQLEINKILRTIQVSMHLVSIPKLLVEASSKIVSAHLDNKIGGIIKYAGTPPTATQLGTIPPELFSHLDRLYSRAYEIAGISQLSATSAKPSGLNSGKALREYNDLETERFMSVGQRYEKVFLDASKQMIDLAKEIDEDGYDYKVKVKGKKFLETIKWNEVSMDDDAYAMSVFPTSSLSSSPAGRLQDVQELIQIGFVSKEDAMKLLDFPDLQAFYDFENAPLDDIMRTIEQFVDKGEYETPEPYQALEVGIVKMQKAYLYFKSQQLEEEKLELFRRWIEDAKTLMDRAEMEIQRQQMELQMQNDAAIQQNAEQVDSQIPTDVTMPQT